MKPLGIIGLLLIVVGVLVLVFGGFSFTRQRRVVDVGPLKVDAQERQSVPISPIVGYACLAGGVVLLVAGGRRA